MNQGVLCYLFACVFWGANLPLTARLFTAFDPFFMAAIRVMLATGVLALLWRFTRENERPALGLTPGRYALMSGLMAGFFMLYNLGLKFTHPITAAAIIAGVPMGSMAEPEDIARAALFLASDDSGFVTGQNLAVNGGSAFL